MTLQVPIRQPETELFFPMQLKQMTKEETKEYHRKKLFELSLKSVGQIPQLEEPTYDQKVWVLHRLKGNARSWQRWFVGLYFTEEQKLELGLSDADVEGKGRSNK